jgi:hypothetical protein
MNFGVRELAPVFQGFQPTGKERSGWTLTTRPIQTEVNLA